MTAPDTLQPPTALHCHTTHFTAFTLQPLPRIHSVRGCGDPVGPVSLFCPPTPPVLTVSGGNFGTGDAEITFEANAPDGRAVQWGCAAVMHAPWAEDSQLLCLRPAAPPLPVPPTGLWAHVWVTAHRHPGAPRAQLPRAILYAGAPAPRALVAAAGPCAQRGPWALADCPGDGAGFGIEGEWVASTVRGVAVGPYPCPNVTVHNGTYLECQGLRGAGGAHAVAVLAPPAPAEAGGALLLSFSDSCAVRAGNTASGGACDECPVGFYGAA